MAFITAVASAIRNYFNFSGRANRREFWFWAGFALLMWLALLTVDLNWIGPWLGYMPMEDGAPRPLSMAWLGFIAIPSLSILVRRMHDHDEPGWKALIILPLGYWLVAKGIKGANRYG